MVELKSVNLYFPMDLNYLYKNYPRIKIKTLTIDLYVIILFIQKEKRCSLEQCHIICFLKVV